MQPESAATVRRLPFLSVPVWDISDEEISEWKKTPGMQFTAYTAERIRDGKYDNGQEVYPPSSGVYREVTKSRIDEIMELLAERGMARRSGGRWYAIAPGRMEPSIRRAVAVLLARRKDLPPALAAELDSWTLTLNALESGPLASKATRQAVAPATPALAIAAS